MNITRVTALTKKEFIQIIRDPRSLALAIAIPVLLLILFSYALTLDVDKVPLAIWNQDNSQLSKNFILNFKNSKYFKIVGYYDRYADLQDLIDKNKVMMAMIIPKDFSKYIRSKSIASLQFIIDGSDSNTATIARGYVETVVSQYNAQFVYSALSKSGMENPQPLDMRTRIWFNQDLKSRNFVIPGLIAVIMMIISALLTSLTVSREWERGTMEQLISTPVKSGELILGKFLPYFLIGIFDLLIAVAMGEFMFNVPLRGSVALLFLLSGIFLTGAMLLGMLISIAAKNQFIASQIAIVATFLPAFLLSGFVYAISNMPKAIQLVTYIIPARYFIIILRGIYLKGAGLGVLAANVIFLFLFACIVIAFSLKKFKKKVA